MTGEITPQRINLAMSLDSRDGTLTRDDMLQNYSDEPDGIYKRPGTISRYTGTTGTGFGIFAFNGHLYAWSSGTTSTTPNTLI